MEAGLTHLVLDVATLLLAQVAQHLAEHPFQLVAAHRVAAVNRDVLVNWISESESRWRGAWIL